MRPALFFLALLSISMPVRAQEPLVVPFTKAPAFMERTVDGARTGFIVDLAELIGAEIGVPIAYLDVDECARTLCRSGQRPVTPSPGRPETPATARNKCLLR